MELQGNLTQRGEALLAAAVSGGAALHFTRAASGSGETAVSATELAEERQALAMSDIIRTEDGVRFPVSLVAAQAAEAYSLTEVGVYAADGDGESLYCVYRLTPPLDIDPASSLAVRFELEECFAQAPDITVTPAGTLTHPDLKALRGAPGGLAALNDNAVVPVSQMPYTYGTEELTPGVSPLADGTLHFTYE